MSARYSNTSMLTATSGGSTPPTKSMSPSSSLITQVSSNISNNGYKTPPPPRDNNHPVISSIEKRSNINNTLYHGSLAYPSQRGTYTKRGHRNHRKPERHSDLNVNVSSNEISDSQIVANEQIQDKNIGSSNKRRQVSLNHLLNFQLPPRASPSQPLPSRTFFRHGKQTSNTPFTKERFINANHRFVINPIGDYTPQIIDPDIYFNWHDILQVIISTPNDGSIKPNCPICLSEPAAPRATKCGHVYCFPCILHYLDMGEHNKGRKCPICWEMIYPRELKSVKWSLISFFDSSKLTIDPTNYVEDTSITLRLCLIERQQSSMLALPRSTTWPLNEIPPEYSTWSFMPDALQFARFFMATQDYMAKELWADMTTLEVLASDITANGTPKSHWMEEMHYIDLAKEKVQEQLEKTQMMGSPQVISVQTEAEMAFVKAKEKEQANSQSKLNNLMGNSTKDGKTPKKDEEHEKKKENETSEEKQVGYVNEEKQVGYVNTKGKNEESVHHAYLLKNEESMHHAYLLKNEESMHHAYLLKNEESVPHAYLLKNSYTLDSSIPGNSQNPIVGPISTSVLFYQSSSGQHIYLHPLDIKILRSYFGSYANFPNEIDVKVIAAEQGIMNEDLRKKYKYLSHLPMGCQVTFIECDLSNIVDDETLAPFKSGLQQRRKRRLEKAHREERERARAISIAIEKEQENLQHHHQDGWYDIGPLMETRRTRYSNNDSTSQNVPEGILEITSKTISEIDIGPKTVWGTALVKKAYDRTLDGMKMGSHDSNEGKGEGDDGWNFFDEDEILEWDAYRRGRKNHRQIDRDIVVQARNKVNENMSPIAAKNLEVAIAPVEKKGEELSMPADSLSNYDKPKESTPSRNKKPKKKLVLMSNGGRRVSISKLNQATPSSQSGKRKKKKKKKVDAKVKWRSYRLDRVESSTAIDRGIKSLLSKKSRLIRRQPLKNENAKDKDKGKDKSSSQIQSRWDT